MAFNENKFMAQESVTPVKETAKEVSPSKISAFFAKETTLHEVVEQTKEPSSPSHRSIVPKDTPAKSATEPDIQLEALAGKRPDIIAVDRDSDG